MAMRNLTKYGILVLVMIILSSIVIAFDWNFFDTAIEAIDNPFTGNPDYIRTENFSGFDVIADSFIGNLSWSNLTYYPTACPAKSAITQLGDSVVCTVMDNTSWNESFARSIILTNNQSQDAYWLANNGTIKSYIDAQSGDNRSWNQSHATTLYADISVTDTDTWNTTADFNDSFLDWIDNTTLVTYIIAQNTSVVNYVDVLNLSMKNYVDASADTDTWNTSEDMIRAVNNSHINASHFYSLNATAMTLGLLDQLYIDAAIMRDIEFDNETIIRNHNISWITDNQGYNSTADFNDSFLDWIDNTTLATYIDSVKDNKSWNQSHATTLYADISVTDTNTWNSTADFFDTLTADKVCIYNSSSGDIACNETMTADTDTDTWNATIDFFDTLTADKLCIYNSSSGDIACNYTDVDTDTWNSTADFNDSFLDKLDNDTLVTYIIAQNTSVVNYVDVLNLSMKDYVDASADTDTWNTTADFFDTLVADKLCIYNLSSGDVACNYTDIDTDTDTWNSTADFNDSFLDVQDNNTLVTYINYMDLANNNSLITYIGLQNTSVVNYVDVLNLSMKDYVDDVATDTDTWNSTADFFDTLVADKICIYNSSSGDIACNYTDVDTDTWNSTADFNDSFLDWIDNSTLVTYINDKDSDNNNSIKTYIGLQNDSVVNYVDVLNLSMKDYVDASADTDTWNTTADFFDKLEADKLCVYNSSSGDIVCNHTDIDTDTWNTTADFNDSFLDWIDNVTIIDYIDFQNTTMTSYVDASADTDTWNSTADFFDTLIADKVCIYNSSSGDIACNETMTVDTDTFYRNSTADFNDSFLDWIDNTTIIDYIDFQNTTMTSYVDASADTDTWNATVDFFDTLLPDKLCIYNSSSGDVACNYTDVDTNCSTVGSCNNIVYMGDGNKTLVDWENLSGYPSACPSGAITQLGDTVTCTDSWLDILGDVMEGIFNMGSFAIRNGTIFNMSEINASLINSDDWSNVTIIETQVTDADWWDADADIAADTIGEGKITFSTACAAGSFYKIDGGNDLQCIAPELVYDTTPQLGGYLDTNGQDIGSTDDEIENIYIADDMYIYLGDGQEASVHYNNTNSRLVIEVN